MEKGCLCGRDSQGGVHRASCLLQSSLATACPLLAGARKVWGAAGPSEPHTLTPIQPRAPSFLPGAFGGSPVPPARHWAGEESAWRAPAPAATRGSAGVAPGDSCSPGAHGRAPGFGDTLTPLLQGRRRRSRSSHGCCPHRVPRVSGKTEERLQPFRWIQSAPAIRGGSRGLGHAPRMESQSAPCPACPDLHRRQR